MHFLDNIRDLKGHKNLADSPKAVKTSPGRFIQCQGATLKAGAPTISRGYSPRGLCFVSLVTLVLLSPASVQPKDTHGLPLGTTSLCLLLPSSPGLLCLRALQCLCWKKSPSFSSLHILPVFVYCQDSSAKHSSPNVCKGRCYVPL